jgi:hypothetical protein
VDTKLHSKDQGPVRYARISDLQAAFPQ